MNQPLYAHLPAVMARGRRARVGRPAKSVNVVYDTIRRRTGPSGGSKQTRGPPARSRRRGSSAGLDRDRHSLDRVVGVSAQVPGRFVGLGVALGVDSPAPKLVVSGTRGLPVERPAAPRRRRRLTVQPGRPPRQPLIGAHVDAGDRANRTTPVPEAKSGRAVRIFVATGTRGRRAAP